VRGIAIPADVNASTTYPVAALTRSAQAPTARAFVAYVLSQAGRDVLARAGFAEP
jgi:molybdate transport system substrate-binding protein